MSWSLHFQNEVILLLLSAFMDFVVSWLPATAADRIDVDIGCVEWHVDVDWKAKPLEMLKHNRNMSEIDMARVEPTIIVSSRLVGGGGSGGYRLPSPSPSLSMGRLRGLRMDLGGKFWSI